MYTLAALVAVTNSADPVSPSKEFTTWDGGPTFSMQTLNKT